MTKYLCLYMMLFALPLFGQNTPIDTLANLSAVATVGEKVDLKIRIREFLEKNKDETLVKRFTELAAARKDPIFLELAYLKNGEDEKRKNLLRKEGYYLDEFHGRRVSIYNYLNIYPDKAGTATFEEIKNNEQVWQSNQTADTSNHYNPEEVYWAKLILHGDSEKNDDYLFHFSPHYHYETWSKIEVWLVHENDSIEYFQTGDRLTVADKPIASKHSLLRFNIQQNEKVKLYFRMEGTSKHKKSKPNQIKIRLMDEEGNPGAFVGYPFKGKFHLHGDAFSTNRIAQHDLYIDPTGKASIDEIVAQQDTLAWNNAIEIKHQADKVYWMRTRFYGSPYFNGEQILHISASSGFDVYSFHYIDSYVDDGKGGYHHQRTGDRVPLKDRAYNHWAKLIKLNINPRDTLDLFIRMEGADSRRLIPTDNRFGIFLYHVDPLSLFPTQSNYAFHEGLLFGILGIQGIFFFLLFLMEREKTYFYLMLLIVGLYLGSATDISSTFQYIGVSRLNNYSSYLYPLGLFFIVWGLLKFIESYFNYPKSSIYRKYVVPVFIMLSALVCINSSLQFQLFDEVGNFYISSAYNLLLIGILFISFIIAGLAIYKAPKQKNATKIYLVLAFGPLTIVMILYIFILMLFILTQTIDTVIENALIFENMALWLDYAMIAMVTLLALSVGYRNNRIRADKLIAEQKNIFDQKEKENAARIKRTAEALEIQNAKNEVLLKEIHHRVKNNLQTISSLLSLQSKSINDPTALDAVQESRNRVASMALIHQKLYQGENLAAIEMRDYFKTIGRAVLKSFGDKAKGVKLEVKMPEIELDVDTAIPIGLITNELITNSLKYAFQQKNSGKIFISMTKKEGNLIYLQIADDGINQSTGISEGGTGFGTMLIKLLTRQLKGELEQSTEQGTATVVKFLLSTKAA